MNKLKIMRFESLLISSNMYIIESGKSVIIIDPCESSESLKYLNDNELLVNYIILTHEHYDHISGVNCYKELFDCKVICNKACGEAIQEPSLNFSKYFNVLIEILPNDKDIDVNLAVNLYSCTTDIAFENQMYIYWKGHSIDLISTPGHSKGSISILVDNKFLFSGDSLLKDYPTVTRLKGGNSKVYREKTINLFNSLSSETIVYPGHYESFVLKDKTIK